jgi:alpha-tubulin suppressor-like RCC1 family protein
MRITTLRYTAAAALATALAAGLTAPASASSGAASSAVSGSFLQAWGSNVDGELGNGTTADSSTPGAVKVPAGTQFTSARCLLSCLAVTTAGQVYSWGRNDAGQLGDGTTKRRLTPVRVHLPAGVKVTAVRPGGSFSLALTSGGKLLAWGANASGELGTGTAKSSRLPVPVRLPKGVTIKAISAGQDDSLALASTGRVLSWGGNGSGQLGTGTTKGRLTPGFVSLPKGTTVASIAAGPLNGYAVTKAGGMLAWGRNNSGQLGDGTTQQRNAPVRVKLPKGATVVAAVSGSVHALALTKGGKVLAWGNNFAGQLGIGTRINQHKPVFVTIPHGDKVSALAAGMDDSLAMIDVPPAAGPHARGPARRGLPDLHGVLAWGGNESGQLGTGTTVNSLVPEPTRLSAVFEPIAIGSGWGSTTSIVVCQQIPV